MRIKLTIIAAMVCLSSQAAIKNVILMIPDGTSIPVLSLTRWYNWYVKGGSDRLAVDPFLCALVKTHSSDAPIGDSAPTTSTYMTGYLANAGYVSTYAKSNKNDIYPLDSTRHLQPLTTLAEAARIMQNKAIGVVATSEFTHATPADVTAHTNARSDYNTIKRQMVHNGITFLAGGGQKLLDDECLAALKAQGVHVATNINDFRKFDGEKMWGVFSEMDLPYDIDRDTSVIPSLKEMTIKAIDVLSKKTEGFFLMVEGSKVDWAAHANDPVGIVTEFRAFDDAVGAAIEFAKKDGETLILVLPDHGNSGISIGTRSTKYTTMPISTLMGPFKEFKTSAEAMDARVKDVDSTAARELYSKWLGIDLTAAEARDFKNSAKIITSRIPVGFTTGGHTGEDVFLAAYNPCGEIPRGLLTNIEVNHYLARQMGIEGALDSLTAANYVKHTDVFKGMKFKIEKEVLTVGKLRIHGNSNRYEISGKTHFLPSVVIYNNKNNAFYLPLFLKDKVNGKN